MSIISMKDVRKTFKTGFFLKKVEILKGISFEVEKGEIFGFLGPNGSGKTTTIKILLGLIFSTSGQSKIFGQDVLNVPIKRGIGFLPDSPYFYHYLTGQEFLDFYGQLFSLSAAERRKKVAFLLELVGLEKAGKLQLRKYSKGMLQRIGLAQALINDPELVIMDEPMTGLDPVGRKDVRDIIVRLKEQGKTVFFSTHILSDVEMICDRIAIVVQGKIKGQGLLSDILRPAVQSVEMCVRNGQAPLIEELQKEFGRVSVRGNDAFFSCPEAKRDETVARLVSRDVSIISVIPHRESLENIFMGEIK